MTLHERVKAAAEARLAVAQAATPGPWDSQTWGIHMGGGSDSRIFPFGGGPRIIAGTFRSSGDPAFIAANDPARIIRDCQRDLKVLARHHTYGLQLAPEFRKGCVHCRQGGGVCDEIRDLAEAYEIGVDDGDG